MEMLTYISVRPADFKDDLRTECIEGASRNENT